MECELRKGCQECVKNISGVECGYCYSSKTCLNMSDPLSNCSSGLSLSKCMYHSLYFNFNYLITLILILILITLCIFNHRVLFIFVINY